MIADLRAISAALQQSHPPFTEMERAVWNRDGQHYQCTFVNHEVCLKHNVEGLLRRILGDLQPGQVETDDDGNCFFRDYASDSFIVTVRVLGRKRRAEAKRLEKTHVVVRSGGLWG